MHDLCCRPGLRTAGNPLERTLPSFVCSHHARSMHRFQPIASVSLRASHALQTIIPQACISPCGHSKQSNVMHRIPRHRPQTVTCRPPNAASVNPVTAVRSMDSAANHQPLSQQQLLDLGATFVRCWFSGIAKGPQAVEEPLSDILDQDVMIMSDKVRVFHDTAGLTEVFAELERSHLEYHRSEHRPMLYAVSEQAQRVYALVEGRYQDVGALPGHPATFRISKVHHILVLQVGSSARVQRLWLRRQMTEEDKDELLHDPLACYPSPFPRDSLRLTDAVTHEVAAGQMVNAVKFWWQAWSGPRNSSSSDNAATAASSAPPTVPPSSSTTTGGTGTYPEITSTTAAGITSIAGSTAGSTEGGTAGSTTGNTAGGTTGSTTGTDAGPEVRSLRKPSQVAEASHILSPDFKLWDAYGLWPSMRAQGKRHLNREAALHHLQQLRYAYNINIEVVDVAVAEGSLVCFSHWQAKLTPRWSALADDKIPVVNNTATNASKGAAPAALAQQPVASEESGSDQEQIAASSSSSTDDDSFIVDSIEVDVFNDQLQLQDIWMFRGPIGKQDQQLFLEYDREQQAQQAATAASAQEVIRAQRRAQREQQLEELLTWMTNYQQQWSDYVKHVQKALERQQQLAKQQIQQQAFVVDQLAQRYQELQQQHAQQQQQQQALQRELDEIKQAGRAAAALPEQQQQQQQQQQQGAASTTQQQQQQGKQDSAL